MTTFSSNTPAVERPSNADFELVERAYMVGEPGFAAAFDRVLRAAREAERIHEYRQEENRLAGETLELFRKQVAALEAQLDAENRYAIGAAERVAALEKELREIIDRVTSGQTGALNHHILRIAREALAAGKE